MRARANCEAEPEGALAGADSRTRQVLTRQSLRGGIATLTGYQFDDALVGNMSRRPPFAPCA